MQTALSALKDEYNVYFVSDCSGGVSGEAHEDAKRRMIQAGARPVNWITVVTEWAPDSTRAVLWCISSLPCAPLPVPVPG